MRAIDKAARKDRKRNKSRVFPAGRKAYSAALKLSELNTAELRAAIRRSERITAADLAVRIGPCPPVGRRKP